MLIFQSICFLKVGNVDIFLRLSLRQFHSLMADEIQDFCIILVRLRGTVQVYFYCFSRGNQKFH